MSSEVPAVTNRSIPEYRVRHELLEIVFRELGTSQVIAAGLAATVALVQAPRVGVAEASSWFGFVAVVTSWRVATIVWFRRARISAATTPRWWRRFVAGTWAAGFAWGLGCLLVFPSGSVTHQVFLAFVMAGVSAGAITTLSPVYPAALGFLLLSMPPLGVRFLNSGGELAFPMGVMVLAYTAVLAVSAKRVGRRFRENVVLHMESEHHESEIRANRDALRAHVAVLGRLQALNVRTDLDADDRLVRVLNMGRETFGTETSAFCLREDGRLVLDRVTGIPVPATEADRSIPDPCRTRVPVRTHRGADAPSELFGMRRWIVASVTVSGRRVGALMFASREGADAEFSHSERSLAGQFAQSIGAKMERTAADEAKDEFLAAVSHELRTPLTSIGGSLSLLGHGALGDLPEPAVEVVALARRNCDRLEGLIDDLLTMEQLEHDRLEVELTLEELGPLVRTIVEDQRRLEQMHAIRLELGHVEPDVRVNVDAARLGQVLQNLLSNAAKFSPTDGRVTVSVRDLGDAACVVVEDRGPGISPEEREAIFERFNQLDGSDVRAQGGTGLGLTISRALMTHMGGNLDFDSKPGSGTRFYVELPLAETVGLTGD